MQGPCLWERGLEGRKWELVLPQREISAPRAPQGAGAMKLVVMPVHLLVHLCSCVGKHGHLSGVQGQLLVPAPWGQGLCVWVSFHSTWKEKGGRRKTNEKKACPSKEGESGGARVAPGSRVKVQASSKCTGAWTGSRLDFGVLVPGLFLGWKGPLWLSVRHTCPHSQAGDTKTASCLKTKKGSGDQST